MGIGMPPQRAAPAPAYPMISLGLADEGTQERWHDGTEARAGTLKGPSSPTHEPAQGGFSTPLLFDNPAFSINDSAPDLVATAHRQAAQACMLPLPCLHKAGHQSQLHATAEVLRWDR